MSQVIESENIVVLSPSLWRRLYLLSRVLGGFVIGIALIWFSNDTGLIYAGTLFVGSSIADALIFSNVLSVFNEGIILSSSGVFDKRRCFKVVPWHNVTAVKLDDTSEKSKSLSIEIDPSTWADCARPLHHHKWLFLNFTDPLRRKFGWPRIKIYDAYSDHSLGWIEARINRFMSAANQAKSNTLQTISELSHVHSH